MQFLKRLFYVVFFACLFISANAQNNQELRFNKMYVGNLAQIFDSLSSASGKKIFYDREFFALQNAMIRPSNETLSSILQGMSKTYRFDYVIDNSGVIYIYSRQNRLIDEESPKEENKISIINPRQGYIRPEKFNYTLTGQIKDRTTGEAIPYAIISIDGTNIKTNANVDGYFSLLKVPNDTSILLISSVGYKLTKLMLSPNLATSNYLIELEPEVFNLQEVVVSAEKMNLSLTSSDESNLIKVSPKKLSELPQVGEKDILRSLQLMPGISASNESSAGMYIRGGTPDQNLVLFDGFTIYHVDHLYGFFSTFNPNAVKDINLYKGGFEAKYGGRLSSVCDITGKDGNQKNIAGGADISLLSFNAYLEIPYKDKFSSIIAFRRSYQGAMYDKLSEKFNTSNTSQVGKEGPQNRFAQSYSSNVSSYFYDLNGKFTYRPTSTDLISLSIYNGADNLDNSNNPEMSGFGGGGLRGFNAKTNDITKFGNTGISLKYSHQGKDKLYLYNLLSFSNYFSDRDRSNQTTINTDTSTQTVKMGTLENNRLNDFSYKGNLEYKATDNHLLVAGIQLSELNVKYWYSENDTSKILDRNNHSMISTVYAEDNIKQFNNRLLIIPGIRATYYQNTSKFYYEPRINTTFKLTEKITLGANWGKYYQFVNRVIRDDISSGSRDFWILSDGSTVPVGDATHYIASIQYENPNYIFSVEGYYKDLKGISEYSLQIVPAQKVLNYEENFYRGKGYSQGIEFLAQRKTGAINGWVSYTLAQARNQFDVYGSNYFPSLQDVRHEVKFVLFYKYKHWTFSTDWIYASGKPYTKPLGTYTITMLDGNVNSYVAVSSKNSARLTPYHRLDVAATYSFPILDNRCKGNLSFSIFNLYNRHNEWYKEYQVIEGIAVENNVTYLGFTPNLSFSIKF
jgi:hypothetical protein